MEKVHYVRVYMHYIMSGPAYACICMYVNSYRLYTYVYTCISVLLFVRMNHYLHLSEHFHYSNCLCSSHDILYPNL